MIKIMGQMTLSSDEKDRIAEEFNEFAEKQNLKVRISVWPSAKFSPSETISDKDWDGSDSKVET